MTAEDFEKSFYPNEKPVYYSQIDVVDMLEQFSKLKCEEQRKLCLQSALIKRTCAWSSPEIKEDFEDGDFNYYIHSDSILNAKEPEI